MSAWNERLVQRHTPQPYIDRVATCWQLRSEQGRTLTCAVYRTEESGMEVRASFNDDNVLRTERTATIATAHVIASEWREALLQTGDFSELG